MEMTLAQEIEIVKKGARFATKNRSLELQDIMRDNWVLRSVKDTHIDSIKSVEVKQVHTKTVVRMIVQLRKDNRSVVVLAKELKDA